MEGILTTVNWRGYYLLILVVTSFIVIGIAESVLMIVGEMPAVEGVMCVLCGEARGTLNDQNNLQMLLTEGVCDVRT